MRLPYASLLAAVCLAGFAAAAGTYDVHCVYHDDTEHMVETVVVR